MRLGSPLTWLAVAMAVAPALACAAELTPDQLRDSVLANFPLIEEAELKSEAARNEVTAAQGEFDTKLKVKTASRAGAKYDYLHVESSIEKQLPTAGLQLFAGHVRGAGDIPAYTGKYRTSGSGEIFAGLRLPLLRNRGIDEARLGQETARLGLAITEQEARLKKNLYLHKALSTYEKWRLAHKKHEIRGALLRIALERESMLKKKVQAGDVERIRLVDNQRSINKRQEELLGAELELQGVGAQLGLYYRDKDGAPVDIASLKPVPASEPREAAPVPASFTEAPQLAVIDQQLRIAERNEELGRSLRLPSLNLEAGAFKDLAPVAGADPSRVQVAVQLEIPLENRKGKGKEGAARSKTLALERQRVYARNELEAAYVRSHAAIRLSRERSKVLKQELESARAVSEAERRRWQHGDSDLFIVTLREQDVADVEAKLWTSYYELETARLDTRLLLSDFVK